MRLTAPLAVGLAAYAAVRAVGADPRAWGTEAGRLRAEIRDDLAEAIEAGRRAGSRAERRLDRDVTRAREGLSASAR